MLEILERIEKAIVVALLVLMMIALLLATVELGIILYQEIMKPPVYMLNLDNMLEVFGFFLMVLIGLELLETIKAYLQHDQFHLEIVFIVAMIAIARKIIILDYKSITPTMLLGMSAAVIALSAGYYFVKRARDLHHNEPEKEEKIKSVTLPE